MNYYQLIVLSQPKSESHVVHTQRGISSFQQACVLLFSGLLQLLLLLQQSTSIDTLQIVCEHVCNFKFVKELLQLKRHHCFSDVAQIPQLQAGAAHLNLDINKLTWTAQQLDGYFFSAIVERVLGLKKLVYLLPL